MQVCAEINLRRPAWAFLGTVCGEMEKEIEAFKAKRVLLPWMITNLNAWNTALSNFIKLAQGTEVLLKTHGWFCQWL